MRKLEDEEEVQASFEQFKRSPQALTSCEDKEDAEEQQVNRLAIDRHLQQASAASSTVEDATAYARKRSRRDCRRAVVSVDCTIASYAERWGQREEEEEEPLGKKQKKIPTSTGHMMLEGVVNFPYSRLFVPMEVRDLPTLLDTFMQDFRVFSIHAQHHSKLIMQTSGRASGEDECYGDSGSGQDEEEQQQQYCFSERGLFFDNARNGADDGGDEEQDAVEEIPLY